MSLQQIDGIILKRMILSAANHLEENKNMVDALNVFPVPDGDTGTNMSLTLQNAAKEVNLINDSSISVIADTLASASLRGARGNSGVILSQLCRGFSKELKGYATINTVTLAAALKAGVDTAYRAVMKPTEGTILTVAREAAEKASFLSENNKNMIEVVEKTLEYAKTVLEQTTDMLPALKQANVVDAGGKGLVLIMEGALHALQSNREILLSMPVKGSETPKRQTPVTDLNIQYTYCTEFIINKRTASVDAARYKKLLESNGDSLMVIDDERIIKTHIHTNNPGLVIQEALKLGELVNIKIDNMKDQHRSTVIQEQNVDKAKAEAGADIKKKKYGFISVAVGDGIINVLKDMGVDEIIQGGQTMNPSTEDILQAVENLQAEHIIILPNNKNIILAAEQAKTLSTEDITVLPTKSIPQGLACMVAFKPSADLETNRQNMIQSLENVKTGQITYAVRNTVVDDSEIREGDILGLIDGKIVRNGKDIDKVLHELLEDLVNEESSIITIFYGQDVDAQKADELHHYIEEHFPDCDVEIHDGGQPLYYYTIAVE